MENAANFVAVELVVVFVCFETWFLSVALAILELTLVDEAGLKLRDLPASASQVLE